MTKPKPITLTLKPGGNFFTDGQDNELSIFAVYDEKGHRHVLRPYNVAKTDQPVFDVEGFGTFGKYLTAFGKLYNYEKVPEGFKLLIGEVKWIELDNGKTFHVKSAAVDQEIGAELSGSYRKKPASRTKDISLVKSELSGRTREPFRVVDVNAWTPPPSTLVC